MCACRAWCRCIFPMADKEAAPQPRSVFAASAPAAAPAAADNSTITASADVDDPAPEPPLSAGAPTGFSFQPRLSGHVPPRPPSPKVSGKTHRSREEEATAASSSSSHRHREERHRSKRSRRDKTDDVGGSSSSSSSHRRRAAAAEDPSTTALATSQIRPTDPFFIDVRRDEHNAQFKCMYKGDVPAYKRLTSCVGLSPTHIVLWDDGREKKRSGKLDSARQKKSARYWSAEATQLETDKSLRRFRIVPQRRRGARRFDATDAPGNKPEERIPVVPAPDDAADPSAAGGAAQSADAASDLSHDPDAGETHEEYARRRTGEFNAHLRDNPHDVDAWRAFAKFQDDWVSDSGQKSVALLTERKASIYERAMKHNPRDDSLVCEYLDSCRLAWDATTLDQKWRQVLFTHPSSITLWRSYLHVLQSEMARFKVPLIVMQYHKCFDTLRSLQAGRFAAHSVPRGVCERALIDVLAEYCHFHNIVGFGERATAVCQAIIEFALRLPESHQRDDAQRHQTVEFFWDSSCARPGEDGAPGVAEWIRREQNRYPVPAFNPERPAANPQVIPGIRLAHRWLLFEAWRERNHWQAWRPRTDTQETEDDCEDPDRIVAYDDIMGAMFSLEDPALKVELLLVVLEVFGASLPARYSTNDRRTVDQATRLLEAGGIARDLVRGMRLLHAWASSDVPESGRGPVFGNNSAVWSHLLEQAELPPCPATLAEADIREECLRGGVDGWLPSLPVKDARRQQFLRNLFQQALELFPENNQLMLAFIRFEAQQSGKAAKKLAKSFLKQPANRNNLALFHAYALLEAEQSGVAAALKIWGTALSMSMKLGAAERPGALALCRGAVEAMLLQSTQSFSQQEEATKLLVSFACEQSIDLESVPGGGSVPTAPMIARARGAMQRFVADTARVIAGGAQSEMEGLGFAGLVQQGADAVHGLACAAWLEYLVADDLDSACQVFETALERIPPKSKDSGFICQGDQSHELLWTAYLRLVHAHARRAMIRPGMLRGLVLRALGDFPSNPEFLTVLILGEARFQLAGHLRTYFSRALRDAPSAVPWLFAIFAEVLRIPEPSVHRIRALFDRAAQSRAQYCVLMWRMFMDFEYTQVLSGLHRDDGRRSQSTFFRAARVCPGAKILYMDAIAADSSTLYEILNIMQEKELRMRTPIEEVELENDAEDEAAAAAARRNPRDVFSTKFTVPLPPKGGPSHINLEELLQQ
eukprot:m.29755 g.29755  ORF g.29755 m.29755 type:complete len:1216 (+) comp5139_c0_seq1:80-3727(+)